MIPLIDGFYLYCDRVRGRIYLRKKSEDGYFTFGQYRSIHSAITDAKDVILIYRVAKQEGASLEEVYTIETDIDLEFDKLEGRESW